MCDQSISTFSSDPEEEFGWSLAHRGILGPPLSRKQNEPQVIDFQQEAFKTTHILSASQVITFYFGRCC